MKKKISLLLIGAACTLLFVACKNKNDYHTLPTHDNMPIDEEIPPNDEMPIVVPDDGNEIDPGYTVDDGFTAGGHNGNGVSDGIPETYQKGGV